MKRFHWGWGIAAVYIVFAAATLSFVAFAFTVDVDLVRTDYYEHSLRHDDRMRARAAAAASSEARMSVVQTVDDQVLKIVVPATHQEAVGRVELYFAGAPDRDQSLELTLDATGGMQIPVGHLHSGKWVATVAWSHAGRSYEMTHTFVVKTTAEGQ